MLTFLTGSAGDDSDGVGGGEITMPVIDASFLFWRFNQSPSMAVWLSIWV